MAPLKEKLEKEGSWLFKWRGYLPLLGIFPFFVAFKNFDYPNHSHQLDQIWDLSCLAISFIGLGIRFFTSGTVPKGTSGGNTKRQKARVLNTTGMYSIVRNPLYLGNFIIGLGISLFFRLWWFTLIFVLVFWLYYERIIFSEEEFLRKKFGRTYLEWAYETPAFIPRLKNWKPLVLPFSFRAAVKREYHTFFSIIAAFTFLEIVGDFFVEGRMEFDLLWMTMFSLGLLAYIVIRIIRKNTKILKLERK